jgi:hypothetical protein
MNALKHFRKIQAQFFPKRIIGTNINKLRVIGQRFKNKHKPNIDKNAKFKSELPSHIKRYPNFTHRNTEIIDVETRIKGEFKIEDITEKIRVPKGKYRVYCKVKDVRPPQHDYINFKHMSGNEILLNMSNAEFFRKTEIINSLYELSLRMNMKVNEDVRDTNIMTHPYISKTIQLAVKTVENFKVNDNNID